MLKPPSITIVILSLSKYDSGPCLESYFDRLSMTMMHGSAIIYPPQLQDNNTIYSKDFSYNYKKNKQSHLR